MVVRDHTDNGSPMRLQGNDKLLPSDCSLQNVLEPKTEAEIQGQILCSTWGILTQIGRKNCRRQKEQGQPENKTKQNKNKNKKQKTPEPTRAQRN